ncbi:MAG: DUF4139 domain-containing protein [Gemmataceae bacterium]|nr:DUF4139 domain-containing protein [Gemmataceae bacterium]
MNLNKSLQFGLPLIAILVAIAAFFTSRGESAPSPQEPRNEPVAQLKPAVTLPISQVILFNSGVGHFTRSGDVEGEARVDLTFPEDDINDLIKSMTLRDLSPNGKVAAVTYDSHDPIDRTLASFAINLNNSPSLAQILTQARGEQIEVTLINTANQPGNITGKIIGVEAQQVATKDGPITTTVLNMWCAEGVRAVKMSEIQKLRFANPVIENEFRRALETLALSHDSQKKAVSLHFSGEGKRKVEVGYVIENPIWKTTYRLVLDKEGAKKPYLQGWAVVENPTDEDWNKVNMALVSGRPISFKMDLYNPLYVSRPTIEPELFASLRPIAYSGAMKRSGTSPEVIEEVEKLLDGKESKKKAVPQSGLLGGAGNGEVGPNDITHKFRHKDVAWNVDAVQLKLGDRLDLARSVESVATASSLGDYFQYIIDRPVDLARQKSALLPIINKDVEGKRVSIYNPGVQPKHPLLGLKFKNTSGMPLTQGPITVFEGSVYAGDTRVLDLQPDEERLVSYAIDLGTEVRVKPGKDSSRITSVKAVKGIIYTNTLVREERLYDISNRSTTDRNLLIEHPNRKGQGFTFKGTNQPKEEAADVFRFEVPVGAKKDLSYTVIEERDAGSSVHLTNNASDQISYFINLKEAPASLKEKLQEALKVKGGWDKVRSDITTSNQRIQTITADQKRLRDNMRELPKDSELFKRYLKTLEEQETEMDTLQAKLKTLQGDEAKTRLAYDHYLANLSAE